MALYVHLDQIELVNLKALEQRFGGPDINFHGVRSVTTDKAALPSIPLAKVKPSSCVMLGNRGRYRDLTIGPEALEILSQEDINRKLWLNGDDARSRHGM